MTEQAETKMRLPSKPKSVAEYLTWQINLCGKKQLEIAEICGFGKANIITMIKQGKTKLPLDKVGKMAKAIEVDPIHLFKMVMQEYMPETWTEVQRMIGQEVITENELEFIKVIRESNVINPKLRTEEERIRLLDFVGTLHSDNETQD